MTIPQIKAALPLAQVLAHYHLEPDKKLRLSCPFHDDTTPSMQVYYKTQTAYCFSGNCPTHGKSLDVIDFVLHKEACTKHEALERCKAMIGGVAADAGPVPVEYRPVPATELPRSAVLLKAWTYMRNAVSSSATAREYLADRGLDGELLLARGLEVGYQAGQMHHGQRAERHFIASLVGVGLLTASVGGRNSRSGGPAYVTFAKGSVAFALKGEDGKVEGLYFRRISSAGKGGRHYYLRDRRGLYPRYPAPETRRLLLTESIVDAVSVLQAESTAKGWSVLALFGTNGYTAEHAAALAALAELGEVCLFLNGDGAGRKATGLVAAKIRAAHPKIKVSAVPVPEGEDCNSLLVAQGPELLAHLIEERLAVGESSETARAEVFSSTDPAAQRTEPESDTDTPDPGSQKKVSQPALDTTNAVDLVYRGAAAELRVKGLRTEQLDTLKVTLKIRVPR